MRRLKALCLILLLCGCTAETTEKAEYEHADLTAAVTSDLHYSASPSVFSTIVPLEPLVKEVTDAMTAQVIAMKPDAFIMTGDNTNNAKTEDVRELAEKLKKIKDAGIEIILTPGNHDYGQSDASIAAYETYFLPLLDIDEKDPASFSYVTEINGVTILAMDDSHPQDSSGYFSGETMQWLKKQLEKAKQKRSRVLFLSHHNMICGHVSEMYSSYLIQNKGLFELLKKYDVSLCMSGHQHNQAVWQKDGIYEVLNDMPLQAAHTIGLLTMNDEGVRYHTEEIDLKKYGAVGIYERAMDLIQRQSAASLSAFEKLCAEKDLTREETDKVMDLISFFFDSYGEGRLAEDADDILHHPDYQLMQSVLWDKNYGPWIEELCKNPPAAGTRLEFSWQ